MLTAPIFNGMTEHGVSAGTSERSVELLVLPALLGVRVVLGDVSASIGVTTTTLQREAQDASLFASFSGNF